MLLTVNRAVRLSLVPSLCALMLLVSGSAAGTAAPSSQTSPSTSPTAGPTGQASTPILLTDPVPAPDAPGAKWFPPTGHTLRGSFLDYWNSHGGLAQFGYPITEEFVEPTSTSPGSDSGPSSPVMTVTVQYFQRNRFEHHPENAGTPNEVLLGRLGQDFHSPDPTSSPITGSAYFQETGHNLGGAFKRYWDTHGGLAVQGYPVTEQLQEKNPIDGKTYTVQYFERSRMELHPENAGTEYEVLLGLLGTQLVGQKGYFSGAYPKYGHAADFSWVSGRLQLFAPACGGPPQCGCSIFQYQDTDDRVNFLGAGWHHYYSEHSVDTDLVAFGSLMGVGSCSIHRDAPNYMVIHAQTNLQ